MDRKRIEILLIEDNNAQAYLIRSMLAEAKGLQYSIRHVHYLAEGLRLLARSSFDCALVDLGLPDSKGLESALAVRNVAKGLPIIVLTVLDDEETALKALELDVQDYLIKDEIGAGVLTRSIRYAIHRKRILEELRTSEERLHFTTKAAEIGWWFWDLTADKLTWSDQCKELFGFATDSEVTYPRFIGAIHPEDRGRIDGAVRNALQTGTDYFEEMRVPLPDGQLRWIMSKGRVFFDARGEAVAMQGIAVDITKLKRTEMALRASEQKFSTIFQFAPSFIIVATADQGKILDANRAALEMLGFGREEVIGKTVFDFDLWESREARDRIVEELQREGSLQDLETSLKRRGGRRFVALLSAEMMEVEGEKCVVSLIRDITARKEAEEKIHHLNEELKVRAAEVEEANKELEAFNYTAAHDLRQPLNLIGGYAQAIMAIWGSELPRDCLGYAEKIHQACLSMNRLIEALLEFSRLTRTEPLREELDLSLLARKAAEELASSAPERRVRVEIAEGLSARGDAKLLRIVLDNLLGNAWKYTALREEALITFGAVEICETRAFFVSDNGRGFDPAEGVKIFRPFQRLSGEEEYRGFGIGLATVERIIARHGGRIWAEGKPGRGATFYFTLP